MAVAPHVEVPTMDDFNALQQQVDDQQKEIDNLSGRVADLEEGNPPVDVQPSPDGTQVTDTTGSIFDGELREFRLVGNPGAYRITMDDGAPTGAGVLRLYAKDHNCYQENVDHDWWYYGPDDWIEAKDPTGATPPPTTGAEFADEFNSDLSLWNSYAPDNTKVWQLSRWYGPDWNGWACNDGWMINHNNPATRKPDMYRLDQGNLILDVQRTPAEMKAACGNKKIITSQINTLSYARLGGYWEARIKAPNIPGTNMAFWLMNHKSWPPEVDIVEIVNHGDWKVMSQNLWHMDHTNEPYYLFDNHGFVVDDWHTYGFWWDHANRRMQYFYDGQKTIDTAEPDGYNDPMFIICSAQQGGDWSGPVPDNAQLGPLRFDYVRVYDRPPTDQAQATSFASAGVHSADADPRIKQADLHNMHKRRATRGKK